MFVDSNLLQYGRQSPALAQPSPTRHCRVFPNQQIITGRQTNRSDVRRKLECRFEFHKCQIVFVRKEIVFWMDDFTIDRPFDVRQLLLDVREVVLTDTNANLGVEKTKQQEDN